MSARFIISAADLAGCPQPTLPEVGIIGRSNAGKSTLINQILGRDLARVSKSPGKTTLLNFFAVNEEYILVDMPGYGYAARSHKERESWSPMIEGYLENRENLRGLILVVDSGRPWTKDEDELLAWLNSRNRPVIIVFNKVDKRTQKELSAKKKEIAHLQIAGKGEFVKSVVYISAKSGRGIEELSRTVFEKLVRPC